MSDIRHDLIFWYVAFIVCWGIVSGMIVTAQMGGSASELTSYNDTAANYSSTTTAMQEGPGWLYRFVQFQTSIWFVNAVILGIPAIYLVWIVLTYGRGY